MKPQSHWIDNHKILNRKLGWMVPVSAVYDGEGWGRRAERLEERFDTEEER